PLRENIQPTLSRPRPPARRDVGPARREPTPVQREPTPIQREPTPVRREASRDAALRRPVPPPPPPPAPMSPPRVSSSALSNSKNVPNRFKSTHRQLRNGFSRCAGCSGAIAGRIVSAMGSRWHPHCFKCNDCGTLLEHVSSYEHEGKAYCHLDYHDRFAPRCYHCKTPIVDERFIALDDPALGGQRYYHELHFFCAECGDPFLDPSASSAAPPAARGQIFGEGDGDDDVGFTVFNGHPYCESCHVRLRMPRCGTIGCGKPIREEAIEALGRKWHWKCFTCDSCKKPFEDPSFFQRGDSAFCDPCYRILLKN
ncbi:hypothetical protein B0J17DRAFT_537672, partial [Rhizoctonia solani]